uniref:BHLH domain-containing protein n=1 Tax=Oryza glumipatula TaxID=40148 RepID=A0A0D9Z6C0_9ORYZ
MRPASPVLAGCCAPASLARCWAREKRRTEEAVSRADQEEEEDRRMKGRHSGKEAAAAARSMAGGSERGGVVEDPRLVKQVRELRRLVPCRREPCGLGELFQDAASHIEDLQVQVKLMRMLLEKLSEE